MAISTARPVDCIGRLKPVVGPDPNGLLCFMVDSEHVDESHAEATLKSLSGLRAERDRVQRWIVSDVFAQVSEYVLADQPTTAACGIGLIDVCKDIEEVPAAVGVDLDSLISANRHNLIRQKRRELSVVVDFTGFSVKLKLEGDCKQCS